MNHIAQYHTSSFALMMLVLQYLFPQQFRLHASSLLLGHRLRLNQFFIINNVLNRIRDRILTDFNNNTLINRIKKILDAEDISSYEDLLNNSVGRKIKSHMRSIQYEEKCIRKYHYRPFDFRYIYYKHNPDIMERNRYTNIIFQLFRKNTAIITS